MGYWLRFETNSSNVFTGESIFELSVELNEGWNLITGITSPTQTILLIDPDDILIEGTFYGFNGFYEIADILMPGIGYWVKANTDGIIVLSSE